MTLTNEKLAWKTPEADVSVFFNLTGVWFINLWMHWTNNLNLNLTTVLKKNSGIRPVETRNVCREMNKFDDNQSNCFYRKILYFILQSNILIQKVGYKQHPIWNIQRSDHLFLDNIYGDSLHCHALLASSHFLGPSFRIIAISTSQKIILANIPAPRECTVDDLLKNIFQIKGLNAWTASVAVQQLWCCSKTSSKTIHMNMIQYVVSGRVCVCSSCGSMFYSRVMKT